MNTFSPLPDAVADMLGVAAICAVTIAALWLPALVGA